MAQITLDEFRRDAEAFLDANAETRAAVEKVVWGEGEDRASIFEEKDPAVERAELEAAKAFRAKRYDAGFAWITGPAAYGGRELPTEYERAYHALEAQYAIPPQTPFSIGLGMVAPTILAHATEQVKDAYLAKLHRGDVVACQLFSEPGAGSDLAGLNTRAERDGDEWVVTGQKVWTSGAQHSDIGELLCRTNPDLPKHKGLTAFIVDMRAPGVEVRPLRQITGGASFNEVFFNEVRIPDSHRLGDVNGGWGVALTTLMNERASIGAGAGGGGSGPMLTRLIEMARHFGLDDDPIVRDGLARLWTNYRVASLTNQRALGRLERGQTPGPEMSIAKLALSGNLLATSEFLSRVLGPRLLADTGEWGTFSWAQFVLGVPGFRIAGGSDEVMRNIVAERVLGLPKEPGIDTTSPFKDLAHN